MAWETVTQGHLSHQTRGSHPAWATPTLNMVGFFVPAGFEPVTLTSRSGLTTHSVTDCPTPRGPEKSWRTWGWALIHLCVHVSWYYLIQYLWCNHMFNHYLKVPPWLQVRSSWELKLSQWWKTPRFPPLDPTPLGKLALILIITHINHLLFGKKLT